MNISRLTIDKIKEHARAEYPKEACGFIADGQYWPQENIAEFPIEAFEIRQEAWFDFPQGVEAVIHSHTNGNNFPGQEDMESQIATGLPWGLVVASHDGHVTDPWCWGPDIELEYIGRTWRNGPPGTDGGADCYALLQDYYRREYGVTLKEFPRSMNWLDQGKNFFAENFEAMGFDRISASEVQPGDVFLMAVNSDGSPNHCGIYVGGGLGLHHLMNRLSRHDPIGSWQKLITHWLRYNGVKRASE